MTRMPIKRASFYQSVTLREKKGKQIFSVHINDERQRVIQDYEMTLEEGMLFIHFLDGEKTIIPISNIKEMIIDVEKLNEWQNGKKEKSTPKKMQKTA